MHLLLRLTPLRSTGAISCQFKCMRGGVEFVDMGQWEVEGVV